MLHLTTTEWLALLVGLLLLATRVPAVLWPASYRRTALDLIRASGRTTIRAAGAFLWVLVVTVVALVLRTLTVLQGLLLVLAVLFAGAGAVAISQPEGYRAFSERVLVRLPDWALRCGALVGVALGGWLIYLSLTGA